MFKKEDLQLSDIKSKPIFSTNEYIGKQEIYKPNFDQYNPKEEILEKISEWITKNDEKLTLIGFGASWCGDCKKNLPALIKIENKIKNDKFNVGILSNIKVKPTYERKKGQFIWKSPPSPPETIDPKFDMIHIPTIYIFDKNGTCLGKIDENPEHTDTIEGDILYYLE